MTIASMPVAKKTENEIETRTDGGTEIGKDLENIAKGKIIKVNETFNFLIESRVSSLAPTGGQRSVQIAIVKIIKGNESSKFLFWSRDSHRWRDKERYRSRE